MILHFDTLLDDVFSLSKIGQVGFCTVPKLNKSPVGFRFKNDWKHFESYCVGETKKANCYFKYQNYADFSEFNTKDPPDKVGKVKRKKKSEFIT